MQVAEDLAKVHVPKLVKHCDEFAYPLQMTASKWFLNLFTGVSRCQRSLICAVVLSGRGVPSKALAVGRSAPPLHCLGSNRFFS